MQQHNAMKRAAKTKIIKKPPSGMDNDLAQFIDHTLLKPDATQSELKKMCDEAKQWHFKAVCINSTNISFVSEQLKDTGIMPVAVVGFPLGATSSAAKAFEARQALATGAREIDMVINLGALKSRDYKAVVDDIKQVVEASRPFGVKVILEMGALDDEEKIIACSLAKGAGAAFVKTSTGFGPGGATLDDVRLMRRIVGSDIGVKASGGIKTRQEAKAFLAAGATRLGTSASVAIMQGRESK